ncbi:hypothetical protein B0H19DRAFT_1258302 [Mycena capillaripes]|nr:hypothetical protein B0H19DRAFT_1258302 [Mycena capillaripes]
MSDYDQDYYSGAPPEGGETQYQSGENSGVDAQDNDGGYDAPDNWNQNGDDSSAYDGQFAQEGDNTEPNAQYDGGEATDGGERDNGGGDGNNYDAPDSWNQNDGGEFNGEPADTEGQGSSAGGYGGQAYEGKVNAEQYNEGEGDHYGDDSSTVVTNVKIAWTRTTPLVTKRTSGACWSNKLRMSRRLTNGSGMRTSGSRMPMREAENCERERALAAREQALNAAQQKLAATQQKLAHARSYGTTKASASKVATKPKQGGGPAEAKSGQPAKNVNAGAAKEGDDRVDPLVDMGLHILDGALNRFLSPHPAPPTFTQKAGSQKTAPIPAKKL